VPDLISVGQTVRVRTYVWRSAGKAGLLACHLSRSLSQCHRNWHELIR